MKERVEEAMAAFRQMEEAKASSIKNHCFNFAITISYERAAELQTLFEELCAENQALKADKSEFIEAQEELVWLKQTAKDDKDNCRIVGYEDCLLKWRTALQSKEE